VYGVEFIYPKLTKSIGGFEIDAFVTEHYSHSNKVTEIPVEEGSVISDHVTPAADEIQIKAFIGKAEFSAWEGGIPENNSDIESEDPKARIIQAYYELLRLKEERQPVDLVTGLGTFPGMVITNFDISRDASTGKNLPFDMAFKKVRIVKSETTTINASSSAVGGGDQTSGIANGGLVAGQPSVQRPNYMQEEAKGLLNDGSISKDKYLNECLLHGWVP
jgi:hypothetical protein